MRFSPFFRFFILSLSSCQFTTLALAMAATAASAAKWTSAQAQHNLFSVVAVLLLLLNGLRGTTALMVLCD